MTAVVLAYGAEPHLEECVQSVLGSTSVTVEVIVVDNEAAAEAIAAVEGLPSVRIVRPGRNTGFAGGCNLGAGQATAATLVFVNSDAVVDSRLHRRARGRARGPGRRAGVRERPYWPTAPTSSTPWATPCTSSTSRGRAASATRPISTPSPHRGFDHRRDVRRAQGVLGAAWGVRRDATSSTRRMSTSPCAPGWPASRCATFPRPSRCTTTSSVGPDAKFYFLERNRLINLLTTPRAADAAARRPTGPGGRAGTGRHRGQGWLGAAEAHRVPLAGREPGLPQVASSGHPGQTGSDRRRHGPCPVRPHGRARGVRDDRAEVRRPRPGERMDGSPAGPAGPGLTAEDSRRRSSAPDGPVPSGK